MVAERLSLTWEEQYVSDEHAQSIPKALKIV
jgi:hypothetical protein